MATRFLRYDSDPILRKKCKAVLKVDDKIRQLLDDISNKDVIAFLRGEIKKCTDAIKAKEDTINQLQKQIETDQLQITEFQKLIDSLSVEKEDK